MNFFENLAASVSVALDSELTAVVREMESRIDDWFCRTRDIPMTPAEYKKVLPLVVRHMADNYTGTRDYNAWYAWVQCHKLGILDKGLPVKGCNKVSAESERMKELLRTGGAEAVEAYRSVFRGDQE